MDGSEPEYIQIRNCWVANHGRELKTRFRLKGKYAFATDTDTRKGITAGRSCPCCGCGAETPFHFTMQCNAFKDERRAMESEFATVTSETDSFGFALKTNPQKFAFLMSAGVSPQNPNFKTWRAMELALYRYLYAADNKRKKILADRLSDRRGGISF